MCFKVSQGVLGAQKVSEGQRISEGLRGMPGCLRSDPRGSPRVSGVFQEVSETFESQSER